MYLKDIILKATIHINICKGNPQIIADSTSDVRIRLTVADSATAQLNDTDVLSLVCGFHKLFWIPQIQLRIPQTGLFFEQFRAVK